MARALKRISRPLLLNLEQTQALCGLSDFRWRLLAAQGLTPQPVDLPGRARWLRSEVVRWARELGRRRG